MTPVFRVPESLIGNIGEPLDFGDHDANGIATEEMSSAASTSVEVSIAAYVHSEPTTLHYQTVATLQHAEDAERFTNGSTGLAKGVRFSLSLSLS